jgi:hypothetical protein
LCGGKKVVFDGRGESTKTNVRFKSVKLILSESGIEISHEYGNVFGVIMLDKGLEIVPKLLFSTEIHGRILECGWSVYGEDIKTMGSSVENKHCNTGVPWMEIIYQWNKRRRDGDSSMRIIRSARVVKVCMCVGEFKDVSMG